MGTVDGEGARETVTVVKGKHPFRKGTDFVITGKVRLLEDELAVTLAIDNLDYLLVKHMAELVEQLNIQRTAQTGGLILRTLRHVGFEPDGVAAIVAGIVKMKMDLF